MAELKPASARTLGVAKWLGVQLPDGVSDPHARQLIANTPLPEKLVLLAKRIGLEVPGLNYGFAWPLIKKERAKVEAELMATSGWAVEVLISWDNAFYFITGIEPAEGTNRPKLILRALEAPRVQRMKRGKQPPRITGVHWSLSRATKMVYPIDLIDAVIRDPESLTVY